MKTRWKNVIDLGRWHKWFAWYPVRVSKIAAYSAEDTTSVVHYRWVWLETVNRRLVESFAYDDEWSYSELDEDE